MLYGATPVMLHEHCVFTIIMTLRLALDKYHRKFNLFLVPSNEMKALLTYLEIKLNKSLPRRNRFQR